MHQTPVTCINGTFLPAATAVLPVSDRLVRFGDGVFETIRVTAGVPYQWEAHINRLLEGLAALRISPPANLDWQQAARTMIAQNAMNDGFLRLTVSRGIGSRGYLPDATITPNWLMECLPAVPPPAAALKLWVSSVTRPPLSSLPVNYKIAQGIGSTLALLEAHDHGCDEAILLTPDGKLCEAAGANLFWIAHGKIYTPSLTTGCLAGTTRAAVMRLMAVEEVVADLGTLHNVDAIFLTSVRLGAWPAHAAKFKVLDSESHYVLAELNKALAADNAAYVATHRDAWATA